MTSVVLMTGGTLNVLVGQLSVSDTVAAGAEPVRLLFTDASGFIPCYVCTPSFFLDWYLK